MIKRKLTDGNPEERYARRSEKGQFAGSVDDGGLLSADCCYEAKAGDCDRATAAPGSDWL
ncbi:hypothetical protein SAMN02927900_03304 [Rhizobium mongolense subsp. loessense]|uniref:Uncharacterized protein n=1 Tax=Rhizobium mongolense subsp. loessense TaxID=158890 RepID=A0A1G4S0V4_9HYPH|nr:hypothetical protein [Rhizobium mongolense]SCW62922.1 hypothetical protein SAMN02927900_03304 [Rhizobium mongolense subsp. loessense]